MTTPRYCAFRLGVTAPRCPRRADGAIGVLHLCRTCLAHLLGGDHTPTDPRFDTAYPIELTDDGAPLGVVLWVPYRRVVRSAHLAG